MMMSLVRVSDLSCLCALRLPACLLSDPASDRPPDLSHLCTLCTLVFFSADRLPDLLCLCALRISSLSLGLKSDSLPVSVLSLSLLLLHIMSLCLLNLRCSCPCCLVDSPSCIPLLLHFHRTTPVSPLSWSFVSSSSQSSLCLSRSMSLSMHVSRQSCMSLAGLES